MGFLGETAWTEKAGFDKMRTNPASTMGQVAHPFDALWPNHFCTLLETAVILARIRAL